jgi:hypothetical protein
MSTLSKGPEKPTEKPMPPPPDPNAYSTAFGNAAPAPAPEPQVRPGEQTAEEWAREDAEKFKGESDINSSRHVELWLGVARSTAVNAWKGMDEKRLTRREYDDGIAKAKGHCPAEHGANCKNGAR